LKKLMLLKPSHWIVKLPMAYPTKRLAGKMKGMFPWKRRLSYFARIVPQRILDRRHLSRIISDKRHLSTSEDSKEEVRTPRKSSRVSSIIQGFTKEERLEACLLLVDNEHIMAPEKLSEENLEARLKKMFQNADTDGDGDLTQEEFDSWFRRGLDSSTQRFPFDEPRRITADEESQDKVERPTDEQLRAYSLRVALPFFGFGFIDNSLMIMCGDLIDLTLSQRFGVSMLFSAGLGNVFADSFGVYTSDLIEKFSGRFTPKSGRLTSNQLAMKCTRRRKTIFRIVGISTGCCAGLLPLLFL